MTNLKKLGYLIKIDILRTFRDMRYVIFVILLPVIFYFLYTQIFNPSAKLNGTNWATYAMISMAAFGIMGTAINFMGTRLQKERSEKWYDFLKVSSIPEIYYNISKTVSYIVLSFVGIILILLVGFFTQGVRLDFLQICIFFGYLMIGSIVFIALALLISLLGSAAQPLGTLLYLILSFIGGLWMPIDAMPVFLQHIAKFTPSYNYAKVMWNMIGHQSFPVQSIVILIAWFLIFIIIYVLLTKKNSICKK